MIRGLVDFALDRRFFVLALAVLLFAWGVISFHNLPIEAYPDVANNYVQVITQWPGISAEQIEQQVTIPIEIAMTRRRLPSAKSTSARIMAGDLLRGYCSTVFWKTRAFDTTR